MVGLNIVVQLSRKRLQTVIVTFLIIFFGLHSKTAHAELYKYVDAKGKVFYVDALEKVPPAFREAAKNAKPLPPITKVKSFYPAYQTQKSAPERYFERNKPGKGGSKIEIYVTAWCPYCKKLEAWLQSRNLKYTRYDIDRDAAAKKRHLELGGGGVPVLKTGSTIIRGFDANELAAQLG
jgi:glutaredoxin